MFKPREIGRAAVAAALMLGYFIASLPGIAAAIDLGSAARYYLITFCLFLLALFVCTYANPGNITLILRAYVAAAFLSFVAGLAGLLGLFPDLLMADSYRVKGLFKDSNVFGPFFVPAVVLLLDDMKHKRILKAPRALHTVGVALLALGVMFSYSRAAWINLAVSVLVYFMLNVKAFRPARLLRAALIAAFALTVAACILLLPALQGAGVTAFLEERAQPQDYDKERFGTQLGGLSLIGDNPAGVGPGQFERVIAGVTGLELSAHSLYIRTAAENGIAGFLLFFSALACLLFLLWHDHCLARRGGCAISGLPPPTDQGLAPAVYSPAESGVAPAAVIAILAGLLVNSIVVDTLHWRHFWFFIGIALYCVRGAERRVHSDG